MGCIDMKQNPKKGFKYVKCLRISNKRSGQCARGCCGMQQPLAMVGVRT